MQMSMLWTCEGDLFGGSLRDYAKTLEDSCYSGFDLSEAHQVVLLANGDLRLVRAPLVWGETRESDDYSYRDLSLGDQTVIVKIDLRA